MSTIVKNTKPAAKPEAKAVKPVAKDAAKEELKKVKITKPEAPTEEEAAAEVVTIGKAQIVESIREKVKEAGGAIPPVIAALALEALEATITEALQAGNEIRLSIGKFYVNYMDAREGRNPQTGDAVQVEAYWAPKFKPSVTLKRAVNEAGETEGEEAPEEEAEEGDEE